MVIEIVRERSVSASAGQVWDVVSDALRMPEWWARADRVEVLSGEGLGRRQRVISRWQGRPSEVDQVVTAFAPERKLEWRHEAERVDGQPAPRFSTETVVSITLTPGLSGLTRISIASRQQPADEEKEAAMRAGAGYIGQMLETSLEHLEALLKTGATESRPLSAG